METQRTNNQDEYTEKDGMSYYMKRKMKRMNDNLSIRTCSTRDDFLEKSVFNTDDQNKKGN